MARGEAGGRRGCAARPARPAGALLAGPQVLPSAWLPQRNPGHAPGRWPASQRPCSGQGRAAPRCSSAKQPGRPQPGRPSRHRTLGPEGHEPKSDARHTCCTSSAAQKAWIQRTGPLPHLHTPCSPSTRPPAHLTRSWRRGRRGRAQPWRCPTCAPCGQGAPLT
jgi:hypothetical protein